MTEASEPFVRIASQLKVLSISKLCRNYVILVNKFLCQYYLWENILPTAVNEEQGLLIRLLACLF